MKERRTHLTPPYGRLARLIRPFPDFDAAFIKPVRQKAVELINLKQGDRVLDVGCGPGGSFPYLVQAVAHRVKWSVSGTSACRRERDRCRRDGHERGQRNRCAMESYGPDQGDRARCGDRRQVPRDWLEKGSECATVSGFRR